MADDPKLDAIIVNAVRATLTQLLGWAEPEAEPYIMPILHAVKDAVAKAGYVIKKGP